jgi:hypothetical protein
MPFPLAWVFRNFYGGCLVTKIPKEPLATRVVTGSPGKTRFEEIIAGKPTRLINYAEG